MAALTCAYRAFIFYILIFSRDGAECWFSGAPPWKRDRTIMFYLRQRGCASSLISMGVHHPLILHLIKFLHVNAPWAVASIGVISWVAVRTYSCTSCIQAAQLHIHVVNPTVSFPMNFPSLLQDMTRLWLTTCEPWAMSGQQNCRCMHAHSFEFSPMHVQRKEDVCILSIILSGNL